MGLGKLNSVAVVWFKAQAKFFYFPKMMVNLKVLKKDSKNSHLVLLILICDTLNMSLNSFKT